MRDRVKWLVPAALAGLAAFAVGSCSWLALVTFNDLPPIETDKIARQHGAAAGYDVSGSGTCGEYVTQPDNFGGCEVELSFSLPAGDARGREVAVRLRRPSVLHEWQLVSVTPRTPPKK